MEDIVIRSLCKAFDGKHALQGFSATLPAGQVSCIMAPSGGGKTTLLRILLGLEAADSGEVQGLAGLRLSAVFQEDRLLENLSPVANIRLVNPRRPRGEVLAALAAVRLSGCADQPARELSGGMRRRVAILRALLPLEQQGGDLFFGEPPLDIYDWMRTDADGRGMVNVLDCVKLVQNPTLYASFLLWMLSELFESLPEAGDLEKPKLVFFFDEAHTLFRDAPAVLVQKIEQTVKLIRSKGVGVFFVTQSPSDIPDAVLAQLSNRVQHALRAYTPAELKAVRVAAQAFRASPAFRAEDAIMELGVGEALTSFLDEQGVPTIVQRTKIVCPQSLMGLPEPMARMKTMLHDGMEKYDDAADNLSAYEVLTEQADAAALQKQQEEDRLAQERLAAEQEKQRAKEEAAEEKRRQKLEDEERRRAQKLEDEERRRAQKLEDEARRRAERAAEAEQKKLERQREREAAAAKKKAERLQSKIETQLVSAGGRILRRGLLGILKR